MAPVGVFRVVVIMVIGSVRVTIASQLDVDTRCPPRRDLLCIRAYDMHYHHPYLAVELPVDVDHGRSLIYMYTSMNHAS